MTSWLWTIQNTKIDSNKILKRSSWVDVVAMKPYHILREKKRFVAQTVVLHVTPPHPSQAALTNT